MLSSSELTRIMVCKYLVMGCPPVGVFMAARQTGRGVGWGWSGWPPGLSKSADITKAELPPWARRWHRPAAATTPARHPARSFFKLSREWPEWGMKGGPHHGG